MPKIQDSAFPSIRVTSSLRKLTEDMSDKADEKLSEYIRKAVEERNEKLKQA